MLGHVPDHHHQAPLYDGVSVGQPPLPPRVWDEPWVAADTDSQVHEGKHHCEEELHQPGDVQPDDGLHEDVHVFIK